MTLEQFKYSKCPSCKKHGISAFHKSGRRTHKVTCKYCCKTFKINSALDVFAKIGIGILIGVLAVFVNEHIVPTPIWSWIPAIIVLLLCFEYFAPLEEIEESASDSKENRKQESMQPLHTALSKYETKLNKALLKQYDRAEVVKYFDVKNGDEHIDTFCLVAADGKLDLVSIVTYNGGETLDLIPLIKNVQISRDYSVKSAVSNHTIAFFISDDPINGYDYKDIIEYSHNNSNYRIGIKSVNE